jgi:hypothetical protein
VLRFTRPQRPKGFARAVAAAVRAVREVIAAGNAPDFDSDPLWRKDGYRRAFVAAQHDKCGYCETFALSQPAAIDHFAPKAAVHELVTEGDEAAGLCNVRDRTTAELSATGYYWLAYAWDNWVLVCERCNTGWKRSLFPVGEDPHPCPPAPRRKVTPLLLNPFGPEDPVSHLAFDALGHIVARAGSRAGLATIVTCGLDRRSLERARAGFADDACRQIDLLTTTLDEKDLETALRAAQDLLRLGSDDRMHAGMVRSLVLSRLALTWSDLERLAVRLGAPVRRRRTSG